MTEAGKKGAFRAALSYRDFRLLLASMAISQAGDWLYGVALIVFVLDEGGSPGWVAAATILRLLPYVVFGTFGGVIADRYDRRTVMIWCDVGRAALMFALAGAAFLSAPVLIAVLIAFLSTMFSTPYLPAVSAITPSLVKENDLAAANSVTSVVENTAMVLGPAVGGLLLVLGSPELAFVLNGVSFLASTALVAAMKPRAKVAQESEAETSLGQRVVEGIQAIRSSAEISVLVGILVTATFFYGHELVLLVLVSEQRLGLGADGVGFLMAAVGAGGILAAGVTSRLAQLPRPGAVLAVSLVLSGCALIGLAFVRSPIVAYALMALDGAGNIILDVMAITLLQRTIRQDVMGRVFGVMDSLGVAGILVGSFLAPIWVDLFGLRVALLIGGGVLPLVTVLAASRLRAVDRQAQQRMLELAPRVELLSGLGIFEGASRQSLERLAGDAREEQVASGAVVVREGEPADDFYVVRSGTLNVSSAGERGSAVSSVNVLEAGDYFGEIGLLEKIPRTATVSAAEDCVLLRIAGQDFIEAVSQSPSLPGTLADAMVGRLTRTHPSYRPLAVAESAP